MEYNYSTTAGWLIPLQRAFARYDYNIDEVLQQCHLSPFGMRNPESKIALSKLNRLLSYGIDATKNPGFPLEVGQQFHPGVFHVLGYAMLSADCLEDAFRRVVEYKKTVSDACRLHIDITDKQLELRLEMFYCPVSQQPAASFVAVELFLVTIMEFARKLLHEQFQADYVRLAYAPPDYNTDYLPRYFKCPVTFNSAHTVIAFDLYACQKPLLSGNPYITRTHEQALQEFIAKVDNNDLVHKVKRKIYDRLSLGLPRQADIAQELNLSARSLQRKLQEEGTSYKCLLEETRQKLALEYLREQRLSLSEIGYLLGFSSIGSFNRAFKSWLGFSPRHYRERHFSVNS